MDEDDNDFAKVLVATPWSAILIPFALGVAIVVAVVLIAVLDK